MRLHMRDFTADQIETLRPDQKSAITYNAFSFLQNSSLWGSNTTKLKIINGPYTSDGFYPKHRSFYMIDETTAYSGVLIIQSTLTYFPINNNSKRGWLGVVDTQYE